MARKKRSKKTLNRQLDELWKKWVRHRAGNRCEAKGQWKACSSGPLHAHHVVPRGIKRLCFDPRNGVALCYMHHLHWAHKDARAFSAWFESYRPEDASYQDEKRKELTHRSVVDLEDLLAEMKVRAAVDGVE